MELEDFKAAYPDFSEPFTDDQISLNIDTANLMMGNMSSFGTLQTHASQLMTAHLLYLSKFISKTGAPIQTKTSKKVGSVEFDISVEQGDRGWYGLSGFGQQLLMLIDMQPKYGGAFVV